MLTLACTAFIITYSLLHYSFSSDQILKMKTLCEPLKVLWAPSRVFVLCLMVKLALIIRASTNLYFPYHTL